MATGSGEKANCGQSSGGQGEGQGQRGTPPVPFSHQEIWGGRLGEEGVGALAPWCLGLHRDGASYSESPCFSFFMRKMGITYLMGSLRRFGKLIHVWCLDSCLAYSELSVAITVAVAQGWGLSADRISRALPTPRQPHQDLELIAWICGRVAGPGKKLTCTRRGGPASPRAHGRFLAEPHWNPERDPHSREG